MELKRRVDNVRVKDWKSEAQADQQQTRAGDEGLRRGSSARANELYTAGGGERTGST